MFEVWVKRFVDVAIAGTALVVCAPLLAVVSAAIRLESPGPIVFSQIRIGRGRAPIRTFKLRTMVVGAERLGLQITAQSDPRITRVGRWLRKTKLDELPQLWNVVRGEMSLVGPRPEVARYVDAYPPEWNKVFSVRPGITDLASLTFRDEERLLSEARDRERAYLEIIMPMKIQLALEGVERSSVRYDLAVMGRTALAILRGGDPEGTAVVVEARRRIEQLNESSRDA